MARQSREEKTIDHAEVVVEDLKKLYNIDGLAYIEYNHLLNEYKKISKRFNKTLTMNDAVGKSVIIDNEQLKENVDYTVQTARKKILYNIEEHRKTKETLAKHSQTDKEIINKLKKELKELRNYTQKLEHDLNINNEVQHTFYEDINVKSSEINPPELLNHSYERILKRKIETSKEYNTPLVIAKLTIDEFNDKQRVLKEQNSDKMSLLKVFYKFFHTTLGGKHITYYFSDNVFYLILINTTIEQSKSILQSINVPRQISNIKFTFSIGVTQLDFNTDDFKSINDRLNKSNNEAAKEDKKNSIGYN